MSGGIAIDRIYQAKEMQSTWIFWKNKVASVLTIVFCNLFIFYETPNLWFTLNERNTSYIFFLLKKNYFHILQIILYKKSCKSAIVKGVRSSNWMQTYKEKVKKQIIFVTLDIPMPCGVRVINSNTIVYFLFVFIDRSLCTE